MAWIKARKLKSGRKQLYVWTWFKKPGAPRAKKMRFSVRDNDKETAKKIRSKIETMIAEGTFYSFLSARDRVSWTLEDLREPYLDHMKALKPKSDVWRRACFDHVAGILGEKAQLDELDESDRDRYVRLRLKEKPRPSNSTVNQEVAVFNHSMKMAYRWRKQTGLTAFRFMDWTKLDPKETERPAYQLSVTQIEKLLDSADELTGAGAELEVRQGAIAFELSLETGARLGQIRTVRWPEISADGVWARAIFKRGEPSKIRIPVGLLAKMRQIRQESSDYVFASLRRPGKPRHDFRSFWEELTKKAGLSGVVQWRDIRHAAGTELTRRRGLRAAQRVLGHTDARTTEGYAHDAEVIESVGWRGETPPSPRKKTQPEKRGPRSGPLAPAQRRPKRAASKTRSASPR